MNQCAKLAELELLQLLLSYELLGLSYPRSDSCVSVGPFAPRSLSWVAPCTGAMKVSYHLSSRSAHRILAPAPFRIPLGIPSQFLFLRGVKRDGTGDGTGIGTGIGTGNDGTGEIMQ